MAEFDLLLAHNDLQEALKELDEKLDLATGDAESAGKRKITNELIEASKEAWEPISQSLTSQLAAANEDVRIGVFYGLIRDLQKVFGDPVAELVTKKVEALPKPEKLEVTDEQLKEMNETRSAMYRKIMNLIELAKSFDQSEGMYEPQKRRANKGAKSGPRAITFVNWFIDDKEFDTLTEVIKQYPQYAKTVDLRKAIIEKGTNSATPEVPGVDLKNPPARFEFTLPDGKTLIGVNTKPEVTTAMAAAGSPEDDTDDDE